MLAQCQVHLPFRHDPAQISDPTHGGGGGDLTLFVGSPILILHLLLLLHASELCISNTVTTENKTNKLIFICRERSKIKYISLYIQDKHQVNWRDLSSFLTSYLRNLIWWFLGKRDDTKVLLSRVHLYLRQMASKLFQNGQLGPKVIFTFVGNSLYFIDIPIETKNNCNIFESYNHMIIMS